MTQNVDESSSCVEGSLSNILSSENNEGGSGLSSQFESGSYTLLVTLENGRLGSKFIENPLLSNPTGMLGNIIFNNYEIDERIWYRTATDIFTEEYIDFVDPFSFKVLDNGFYTSVFYPNDMGGESEKGEFWSDYDFQTMEDWYNEWDPTSLKGEKYKPAYEVLQKLQTFDQLKTSYILYDGIEMANVQLNINHDDLLFTDEYLREIATQQKIEESEKQQKTPDLEQIESEISYQIERYNSVNRQNIWYGIHYNEELEEYYQFYAPNSYNAGFHVPLHIAVFDKEGIYKEKLVFNDIIGYSTKHSVAYMDSYPLLDGTIFFESPLMDPMIFDPTTRAMIPLEGTYEEIIIQENEILSNNGYIADRELWVVKDTEKKEKIPPFSLETTDNMTVLSVSADEFGQNEVIELPKDCELIDWEKTDTGFQAVFGLKG